MTGLHRVCCCNDYPAGPKCYSLSFSPKHVRWYDVVVTTGSCTTEECGPSPTVDAAVTLGALREFGTQPVIIGRPWDNYCDCSSLVCEVKNYTVSGTWTAALEFCSADCSEGSGAPGDWRVVSSTNLYAVSSVPVAACGPPGFTGIKIVFRGVPATQTLSACGRDVLMERVFGHNTAPMTQVELVYCRRPGTNSCVLDLYSVTIGGGAYSHDDGIGITLDSCACSEDGNYHQTVTGSIGTTTEYAGGFGAIYALAGSPPTSITCRECVP